MAIDGSASQSPLPELTATAVATTANLQALYTGKHVLVTGARGFLGSHLSRALVALGAKVYAVGRTPPPRATENPIWHACDVSNLSALEAVLQISRPDVVFHLAGDAVGSRDLNLIQRSVQGEFLPTLNLLTAVAQRGSGRLVLAASLEEPTSAPAVPTSPYAACKWAGTGFARMFNLLYGTAVVITRPFMTYGPEQRADKLVPYVINALLRGESPRLSSGRRLVDWIYIDDLVQGLLLAGGLTGLEGQELDLGSGDLVSVRAVVEQLARATGAAGSPQFGTTPDRPHEVERRADIAATFQRLGWRAAVTLEDGLRRTVDWYRDRLGET